MGLLGQLCRAWAFRVSQKTQGECKKRKADFKKCIRQFKYMLVSTHLCSASLVSQTLTNGRVFSTRAYHSTVDVPLPGYFLVHLAVKTQELSGGRVEDLGWILILDQVFTPSLFLVFPLGLPPEDHPVTLGSQGGAFHAQRWHQRSCAMP